MLKRFRLAMLPLVAVAGLVVAGAVAASPTVVTKAKPARLSVGVEVLKFTTAGRAVHANGLVTAKLTDNSGHVQTVKSQVALTASAGGSCKVLHLYLQQLNLNLLGLNAHLAKVVLDITGNAHGGVLGSLFCKLTKAKIATAARAGDARALTAAVRRHPGHVLRFSAVINPMATTAANATCPVLDLIVGPLNLQLLGLVVNLNQVHLTVTATQGGGALGNLFCQLANTTTIPTTTTG